MAIIPSFIKKISYGAFKNSYKLSEVIFEPNSKLTEIGCNAFEYTILTSITIPNHVKKIEASAFHKNNELESVNFDENSELELNWG